MPKENKKRGRRLKDKPYKKEEKEDTLPIVSIPSEFDEKPDDPSQQDEGITLPNDSNYVI